MPCPPPLIPQVPVGVVLASFPLPPPPQVPVEVYALYCHKKVEKMTQMGAKKGLKKPTLEEVIRAKVGIHRGVEPGWGQGVGWSQGSTCTSTAHFPLSSWSSFHSFSPPPPSLPLPSLLITLQDAPFNPSMFGMALEEILDMESARFPDRKGIPWVVEVLVETVLRLDGPRTEGIFR